MSRYIFVIPAHWKAETERSQVQAHPGNLARTYLKTKKGGDVLRIQLSAKVLSSILVPPKRKERKIGFKVVISNRNSLKKSMLT